MFKLFRVHLHRFCVCVFPLCVCLSLVGLNESVNSKYRSFSISSLHLHVLPTAAINLSAEYLSLSIAFAFRLTEDIHVVRLKMDFFLSFYLKCMVENEWAYDAESANHSSALSSTQATLTSPPQIHRCAPFGLMFFTVRSHEAVQVAAFMLCRTHWASKHAVVVYGFAYHSVGTHTLISISFLWNSLPDFCMCARSLFCFFFSSWIPSAKRRQKKSRRSCPRQKNKTHHRLNVVV